MNGTSFLILLISVALIVSVMYVVNLKNKLNTERRKYLSLKQKYEKLISK
jgi:hypothetical protein